MRVYNCLWCTTQRLGNYESTRAMELTLVYLVTFFFPDVCLLDSINGILSGLKWTFHSTGFWEILDQVKKSDGSDDRERQILQILFVILET